MEIINEFLNSIVDIFKSSGFATNDWRNYIMIGIACVLSVSYTHLSPHFYRGDFGQFGTECVWNHHDLRNCSYKGLRSTIYSDPVEAFVCW